MAACYLAGMKSEQAAVLVHEAPSLDWDVCPAVLQLQDLSSPGLEVVLIIQATMGQPKAARVCLYRDIFLK